MVRGRGYSSRGGYRGSSRISSSWNGSSRGGYPSSARFSSYSSSMDSRNKYSDRFSSRSLYPEEYHNKSYRSESSYIERDSSRRSPERKRMRTEAPSSRYESAYGGYGSSRPEPPPPPTISDRYSRGYSVERHSSSAPYSSRRDDYRSSRPSRPPSRGSYRGRISTRGSRGLRYRERPIRRRLVDSSYLIRKRPLAHSSFSRKLKLTRIRSAIAKKGDSDKEGSDTEKVDAEKTEEGKAEDGEQKDDDKADTKETLEEILKKKKGFVKLVCPHCNIKVLTFSRYEKHLLSRTHRFAMRKVAIKQKSILGQMRAAQRNTQNELEKSTSDDLTDITHFCPLCKLNYKQKKAVHQLSEAHRNMKKFLMPTCKSCEITFKSPMSYESHLSSIRHLKRKQRLENAGDSGDEDNLENFTTIDSVGDGDGGSDSAEKEDGKDAPSIGLEKVRKVEVYYCDLCKMYLPRAEESEMTDILSKHCKLKVHMSRYLRLKEAGEKKFTKKEETKKEQGANDSTKDDKGDDSKLDDDEAREEKIWADVDKDLGDILAEAESANKSSDEDEEDSHVNGERYDRFKLSIDGTSEVKDNEEK